MDDRMKHTANTHPVWIEGRLLRRRPDSLKILVVTAKQREETISLPTSRCSGERAGQFRVPAWWAFQHRLDSTPDVAGTRLDAADYSALEQRVLANLGPIAAAAQAEAFRTLRGMSPTGRLLQGNVVRIEDPAFAAELSKLLGS